MGVGYSSDIFPPSAQGLTPRSNGLHLAVTRYKPPASPARLASLAPCLFVVPHCPRLPAPSSFVFVLCALCALCGERPSAQSLTPRAIGLHLALTRYKSPASPARLAAFALGGGSWLVRQAVLRSLPYAIMHARPRRFAPVVRAAYCFRAQGTGGLGPVMHSIARIHLAGTFLGKIDKCVAPNKPRVMAWMPKMLQLQPRNISRKPKP